MTFVQYIISSLTRYGLQCAFALAPLPAYLPQYWALCKSSQDPILQSKVPKNIGVGLSRQGSFSASYGEHGDASSSLPACSNMPLNPGASQSSASKPLSSEEGFSPIAILILLLSHTLRLLYCCGSAIVAPTPKDTSDNNSSSIRVDMTVDEVRLDLVMQSMVMIGVQLFLLSAITRSRRTALKKDLPSLANNSSRTTSTANNIAQATAHEKYFSEQTPTDLSTDSSKLLYSHITQKPFRWLNRPSQYWNWHSLRQHIEFLIVITISTSGFCRLYLYPHDAIRCVAMFRNISVLLESCLALPQLMLNYKRKDTTGLSLAMVLGWFTGDLMKMGYFIFGNAGSAVFILGSVFAMWIDLVVVIQIMFWFPTWEVQQMRNRFWFWNKERKEGTKQGLDIPSANHYN